MGNPEHRVNQITDFERTAVDVIVNLMATKRLPFPGFPPPTGVGGKICPAHSVGEN